MLGVRSPPLLRDQRTNLYAPTIPLAPLAGSHLRDKRECSYMVDFAQPKKFPS